MNLTCNSTLESSRIMPGSETILVGRLDFHDLARVIAAASTLVAVAISLYLIWMHALHYTQPREQRYIIRILFMVPVYAVSSYLQIQWYWHAIYFQVISDCYEAFAIASFFALLCHYVAPDLHSQKVFFREMRPVKPWVWPLNWLAACCAGQRGPWRTPKSGLTWFNIVWIGIYHYCFIRVAMTISAVVSQYFDRYCESSNLPVFGHIWIIVINALAVTVAMFCLIQFYVQLRESLAEYRLLVKVVAIKLVVFLSFWQASAISVGTSTLNIVHANKVVAYPDLKVGIPALLLCVEMACFAVMHLWAFPYAPYAPGAPTAWYPVPDADKASPSRPNERCPPSGGFLGLLAILDALNLWDFVKAFGRGMRWLFCGVKRRKEDISYQLNRGDALDMATLPLPLPLVEGKEEAAAAAAAAAAPYDAMRPGAAPAQHPVYRGGGGGGDESAGLMDWAQPNPEANSRDGTPRPAGGNAAALPGPKHDGAPHGHYQQQQQQPPPRPQPHTYYSPFPGASPGPRSHAQASIGDALWGPR